MMCFIFKRQIIFVMFVLFGCLAVHATDDDLVTEQVIIRLDKAGTLSEKIGEDEDKITNLKILGEIGASDLCLISRGMNSKFSNNMPKAKLDNFGLVEEVRNGLSLKLLEMMDIVKSKGDWGVTEIKNFDKFAKNRILEALKQVG